MISLLLLCYYSVLNSLILSILPATLRISEKEGSFWILYSCEHLQHYHHISYAVLLSKKKVFRFPLTPKHTLELSFAYVQNANPALDKYF
jgi:hypothetical protein